jgi:fructokinase
MLGRANQFWRLSIVSSHSAAARYDILGIGNAIVDVVARADDAFLSRHDMRKGGMALIDAAAAEALYRTMPPGIETSGGSAANTCAVAAGLGARVAYLGKVADDQLGGVFRHDIVSGGVHFPSAPLHGAAPTARCLILVTPDAQRTMNTFLGACVTFSEADVDAALVADSAVTYLEGYLFDPPAAQAAFRRAAAVAHEAGRQVALSLSDAFCVDRHRAAFRDLVAGHVDILFANETEICSLYEANDFEVAAEAARRDVALAALTRSEDGSVILRGAETLRIAAAPADVVDTTGAGDAYAAGFLTALTKGRPLDICGRMGSAAAALVIGDYGARPRGDLPALADAVMG